VGVGVDTHHDTLFFRHLAIPVGQVKTDRMSIHFQKAAPLPRMADQARHVHIVRRPFIDEPAGWMGQDCEIGMVHGMHDPLGLLLPGKSEAAVDGPHDQIETAQVFIGKIEAAILQNIDFDPLQQHDPAQSRIQSIDLLDLFEQPLGIEAFCHRKTSRMVGDRQVFEPALPRRRRHFFHPAAATCCRNLIPGLSISGMIEYDLDTARAAESLLVGGTPAKFPDIRFIFSHSGGAFTVLAARIVDDYPKNLANRLPKGVDYEIKRFYYETAHASKAPALDSLKDLVPVSQILFGSDATIRPYPLTVEGLDEYQGFSPNDWHAINRGNAEKLFPRFK